MIPACLPASADRLGLVSYCRHMTLYENFVSRALNNKDEKSGPIRTNADPACDWSLNTTPMPGQIISASD
jgi:hypothetical protein